MRKSCLVELIVIFFIGCSPKFQTELFKNDNCEFEFRYFSDWTINNRQCIVDVLSPNNKPNENDRGYLTISREKTSGKSIDECYKIYVVDYFHESKGKVLKEGESMINGRKTKWMEYEYERGKVFKTDLIYLVFCDDRFFMIRGSSSTNRYRGFKQKFELMINSFVVS